MKHPSYHFAKNQKDGNLYKTLIASVADLGFSIEDDTDLNYMVCESYFLKRSKDVIVLNLSLVESYACISSKRKNRYELIGPGNLKTLDEIDLAKVLAANNVLLLDCETLLRKVVFNPVNDDAQEVTVFNLLFMEGEISCQ
jgi:hypothetical protein